MSGAKIDDDQILMMGSLKDAMNRKSKKKDVTTNSFQKCEPCPFTSMSLLCSMKLVKSTKIYGTKRCGFRRIISPMRLIAEILEKKWHWFYEFTTQD